MDGLIVDNEYQYLIERAYFDNSNGYWRHPASNGYEYVHRIIAGASSGDIVDHINRNKNDNRKANLRIASKSLNNYNKHIENKLGRGVYFDKFGCRFRACISHNGSVLKLGSFKTVEAAKLAYNKKAVEIYGVDAYQHDLPHYQEDL